MSSEVQEIDESGIRAAFADYSVDPGGEIRLDTAAIAVAGRRRVRTQRVFAGAAGAVAVAALVGGAATVQNLAGTTGKTTPDVAADTVGELPGTGRDLAELFGGAGGTLDRPIRAGGDAAKMGKAVAADLDTAPGYLDSASQAGADPVGDGTRWSLLTWAQGDKAAEALVQVVENPVYIAIYPPPYQSCRDTEKADGRGCEAREVAGKGWLKVLRSAPGEAPELRVYLQRTGSRHEQVSMTVRGGAATKAKLAANRSDLGRLPVTEQDVVEALLNIP